MKKNLETFTNFYTRYYRSSYGVKSSNWLFDEISNIIKANNRDDVGVVRFVHKWPQRSIIARFEGYNHNSSNNVIIIGAHQDSVNMWMPSFGRSPGADDDGSGTVTILETFRSLVACNFRPAIPVEFHWYSAEEAGLLGSQDIALKYEKDNKNVIAMLQNDMTGFIGKRPESIGVVIDHVDNDLTNFIDKLIKNYANIPIVRTKCGYACSDHASWTKAGYQSAFVIEGEFDDTNPHIHSSDDAIRYLSFEHMLEFAKLSVSFAVELSHI
jgi:leucyl aminopeptidase